jgi:methionyl-tRNA synthetase
MGQYHDYPQWICFDCGEKYGRRKAGTCTVHPDICDVCGEETMVTEPRDFGHLKEWSRTTAKDGE